jgi:hypothetical protein
MKDLIQPCSTVILFIVAALSLPGQASTGAGRLARIPRD